MNLLKQLIFGENKSNAKALLQSGAKIVDVRTPAEFSSGHVKGAINVPLQEFQSRMSELKAIKEPIVLCCMSGARSGQALSMLKKERDDCANGGGWRQVQGMID